MTVASLVACTHPPFRPVSFAALHESSKVPYRLVRADARESRTLERSLIVISGCHQLRFVIVHVHGACVADTRRREARGKPMDDH